MAALLVEIFACASYASDLPARAQIPIGPDVLEANTSVRRVCVQMGVQAFRVPDAGGRISKGDGVLPWRLGGGVYVQVTGLRRSGYLQVRTLKGAEMWIPEVQPDSDSPSLCTPHGTTMRVCHRDNAPQDVPVHADFDIQDAAPVAWVKRGSPVQLWGYFEQRGRWAFLETGGRVGFVRSEELCHGMSTPPTAEATERFGMIAAPAKADCYQWRRERGANEIRRIVIHNSERTLEDTIAMFRECDPDRPTSAHVGIDRDGRMVRFVEDKFTAFHTSGSVGSGGFNSISLGVEVIAHDKPGFAFMTPQQERSLLDLIRFWSKEYRITMPRAILQNSTRSKAYHDLEYWHAPVTIHRLAGADRGTDCPKFLWPDSVQGDEKFLRWRRKHLGENQGS